MRIKQVLAFLGAATLSLSAFADPSIAPSSAVANATLAQGGAPTMYRLNAQEAQHMRGAFRLADGRTITITNKASKLFVDMDGKREELVPVGPQQFVGRDTGARVSFNQVPYADEVVVNVAAR